jgi:hypothetical protein
LARCRTHCPEAAGTTIQTRCLNRDISPQPPRKERRAGTNRTNRVGLITSVVRGGPEVAGRPSKPALLTQGGHRPASARVGGVLVYCAQFA